MFKPISSKLDITELEESVLQFWKKKDIFQKTMTEREGGPEYVFFEGPPTANGRPGVHHVLARVFKDMFPRYKTMRGFHVDRRGGWDTHGLPVEIEIEKKLGFTEKSEIEEYGIDRFNELCRESVFTYIQEWERMTDRIGFWVDLDRAYITYKNEYIESVWWSLKKLWDQDLLYQGYKVVPYCPRCGTPLSDHEVAQGYEETEDPSVFVRMPLADKPNTSLLVWTTTPWTLPGNVAVAAHPDEEYVLVERTLPEAEGGKERLILARPLLENVFQEEEVEVIESFPGKKLKGKKYRPLFTFVDPDKPAYRVILEDFVTTEDGSGIVHLAPAFGEEDMDAALEHDLPVLMTVNPDGRFTADVRPWSGMFVKDADPLILEDLENRGLLFDVRTYVHTYPFCWRCDTPLLYYARGTWYIRTTEYKDKLLEYNQRINWRPEHIKNGRFGNWLENNVDWALGRERYWGTPLPIWECDECHHQTAVGSVQELSQQSGQDLSDLDLHRPYVDEVVLPCPECEGTMNRVPELIDVWFDSGAMQHAQWHYPFENEEKFQEQHPADFICEAVDQTRGWFYSLHAISTLLFDEESFKNVICLGLILDEEGQKMSKSRGNVVSPWDVLKKHGADAFRWYLYTASPPGQERRFSSNLVGEVVRNFTLTVWNVYSFFVTYANIDEWDPKNEEPRDYNPLDQWLRSELHTLIKEITRAFEDYDVLRATRPIQEFVDVLSNWYLRRSRRRYWKSEADADKNAAYTTLYEVLVTLSKLLAPTMPFLADAMYRNLVGSVEEDAELSVHLDDWPEFERELIDEKLNEDMSLVMKLASLGHAARNNSGIKVRQPLSEVSFSVGSASEAQTLKSYTDILTDELNVKEIRILSSADEAVTHNLNPYPRQLGQKYQALFPKVREAILDLDQKEAAEKLLNEEPIFVTVEGEELKILPEEVEVRAQAKEGLEVASDGAYLAALSTEITSDLKKEGLARDVVRRIQDFRKQADFDISDRIRILYQATSDLSEAIQEHKQYIMEETLTVDLEEGAPKEESFVSSAEFEGEKLTVGLEVVE